VGKSGSLTPLSSLRPGQFRSAFQHPVSGVIFSGRPGAAFTLPALSKPIHPRLLVSINTFCRIFSLFHFLARLS
jgi:hypothetical protein